METTDSDETDIEANKLKKSIFEKEFYSLDNVNDDHQYDFSKKAKNPKEVEFSAQQQIIDPKTLIGP